MKRAIGYIRVSTNIQVERGMSLEDQRKSIEEYCKYKHLDLIKIYEDKGISGAKLDQRYGLQEMLRDAERGEFDTVIATSLSRLGRNLRDLTQLVWKIEDQLKLQLVFLKENIDSSTMTGRLLRNMLGSISEFERDLMVERTTSGKRAAWMEGRHAWGGGTRPYGYQYNKEKKVLDIIPDEAKTVEKIFELASSGVPLREITRKLNQGGYPTKIKQRNGKAVRWHYTTVQGIIHNPLYTGQAKKEDGVVIRAPALVSSEIQKKATALADKRRFKVVRTPTQRLFAGLLRCEICGEPIHTKQTIKKSKRKYSYYVCSGRLERKNSCKCPFINGDELDNLSWQWLVRFIKGLSSVSLDIQINEENHIERLKSELETVDRTLEKLGKEYGRWLEREDLVGDEGKRLIKQKSEGLEREIGLYRKRKTSIEREIKAKKQAIVETEKIKEDELKLWELAEKVESQLENLSFEQKRSFLETSSIIVKLDWEEFLKAKQVGKLDDPELFLYLLLWNMEASWKWLTKQFRV